MVRIPNKPKAGTSVWGECRHCKRPFAYVYYRKPRTVCDMCYGVNHLENRERRNARKCAENKSTTVSRNTPTRGAVGRVAARLLALLENGLTIKRDTVVTDSDILHAPAEKAIKLIDGILNGDIARVGIK